MDSTHWQSEDGEIRVWLEQGAVHIKAVTKDGDPIEMNAEEVIKLAKVLEDLGSKANKE